MEYYFKCDFLPRKKCVEKKLCWNLVEKNIYLDLYIL